MLVTKPLPEEFSAGHMGRLLRLNAMPAIRATAHKMLRRVAFGPSHDDAVSPLHSLAAIVEVDPITYARRHSLLPFQGYAFRSDRAGHHDHWVLAHYLKFGTSTNNVITLCPECIIEDKDFWGFSFWRREHQIRGMRWCARHREPLRYVHDRDAFLQTPREWLSKSRAFPGHGKYAEAPEALKRYQEMASLMLEQGAPESLSRMRDHMAAQAQANGLVLSECATGHRLISDRIFRMFPRGWLHEIFPNAARKQDGEYCCVLDNALKPVRSGMISAPAMAVALVALFDEPMLAMQTIDSAQPPTALRPAGGVSQEQSADIDIGAPGRFDRVPPPTTFSCKNLAQTYLYCHGNHAAMAVALGCPEEEISRLLVKRRKNIMAAMRKSPQSVGFYEFLRGKSAYEAGQIHKLPVALLEAMSRYLHNQNGTPKSHRYSPSPKSN